MYAVRQPGSQAPTMYRMSILVRDQYFYILDITLLTILYQSSILT